MEIDKVVEMDLKMVMVKVKVPANETVSRLVQMGCGRVATDHGSIACSIQEKVESLGAMQKELARSRQLPIAQGGDELVAHVFSFLRVQTEEGVCASVNRIPSAASLSRLTVLILLFLS